MLENIEVLYNSNIRITREMVIYMQIHLKQIKIIVVLTHYGSIVGTKQDGIEFSKLVNPKIECKILIKQ